MNQEMAIRYCPVCGNETAASHCEADGVATLSKVRSAKNALSYQVGDLLADRYRITGQLGRGAYGAVYSAEHTGTGQPCAIKILAIDPATSSDDVVKRFFQEARVTASLRHQNTIRVFDVGQADEGPLFIAMELLSGPSLAQYLMAQIEKRSVLTEAEAIDVAVPLLKSLSEAHRAGLVHRDIKPGNVILSLGPEGETLVKLLDFGIARTVNSSLTAMGSSLGTPAFMSPEQCQGKELDGRSDVYSVAILTYLCVTGRLPFQHKDQVTLMRMQCLEPAPDPRDFTDNPLSDDFVQILMRSLAKSADARFADARKTRDALEALRKKQWADQPLFAVDTATGFQSLEGGGDAAALQDSPTSMATRVVGARGKAPPPSSTPQPPQEPEEATAAVRVVRAAKAMALPQPPTDAAPFPTAPSPTAPAPAAGPKRLRWFAIGAVLIAAAVGAFYASSGPDQPQAAAPPPATAAAVAPRAVPPATAPAREPESNATPAARATPSAAPAPEAATADKAAASAVTASQVEARVAAGLADRAKDLREKIAFMAEAKRLDPGNGAYATRLAELEAELKIRSRLEPATAPADDAD